MEISSQKHNYLQNKSNVYRGVEKSRGTVSLKISWQGIFKKIYILKKGVMYSYSKEKSKLSKIFKILKMLPLLPDFKFKKFEGI